MNEIWDFDTIEDLAGTYPNRGSLRNAIHAIITRDMELILWKSTRYSPCTSYPIMKQVELMTRKYETERGISMTIGTRSN
jgi:hypothetical protein